ncbi:MAG: hypothetical protein ACJAYN_001372 [Bermanella sp.]
MQPVVIASSRKIVVVVSIFMLLVCVLWFGGLESVAVYIIVLEINRGWGVEPPGLLTALLTRY